MQTAVGAFGVGRRQGVLGVLDLPLSLWTSNVRRYCKNGELLWV